MASVTEGRRSLVGSRSFYYVLSHTNRGTDKLKIKQTINLNDINSSINTLKEELEEIEEAYGGDITFIPPVSKELLQNFEAEKNCKLPSIFRHFYTSESNGMHIDNKVIYSIFDAQQKKTFVENLTRANDPKTSPWFKNKPEVFNDYLVIGSDVNICFAIYKNTDYEDPSIYICENPNTRDEVILEKLDFGIAGLIRVMVENAFE